MLKVQLQESDVMAAHLAHMPGYRLLPFAAVLPILCALAFFELEAGNIFAVLLVLIALSGIALRYLVLPRKAAQRYRQRPSLSQPSAVSWDETALTITSARSAVTMPWDVFVQWRDGKDVLLLYVSDKQFHIIPLRAFNSERAKYYFRLLLEEKIGAPKSLLQLPSPFAKIPAP